MTVITITSGGPCWIGGSKGKEGWSFLCGPEFTVAGINLCFKNRKKLANPPALADNVKGLQNELGRPEKQSEENQK